MVNTIVIILTILLSIFFVFHKQVFYYLSIIFLIPLLLFQYRSTKPTDFFQLTEIERVEQLDRMNQYPPPTYRLANIIEARPESIIFFKLENNFINIFDLTLIFGKYISFIFLPIFLIGFFEAITLKSKLILIFTFIPIIFLTIIGHQNLNGPYCLFPIIYSSIAFGTINIFKKI